MDQRLYDAARTGDVDALDALRNADPSILNKIFLSHSAETPLHVATLAGQTKFAMQIITLMPSFARELNRDGFAPLHVASARGDKEIVMELLKLDTDYSLCLQRDKSGRIPLHYAVVRGRIPVIEKLISHCSESLQEVTALGETVLHLAVKNSQFEALKILLGRLKRLECFEMLLSTKDDKGKGRTIAELAEAMKQVQVLELLKEEYHVAVAETGHIDDIAGIMNPRNEIREFAQADQQAVNTSHPFPDPESNHTQNDQQHESTEVTDSSKIELHNLILVAAVLIVTVTYQAGLSPPPTIWKEGANLSVKCWFKKPFLKNYSPKSSTRDCPGANYHYFMVLNTAGFLSCALVILRVTWSYKHGAIRLLSTSIMILILNYSMLLFTLSPNLLSAWVIFSCPPLIIAILYCCNLYLKKKIVRGHRRIKRAWRRSRFSNLEILGRL